MGDARARARSRGLEERNHRRRRAGERACRSGRARARESIDLEVFSRDAHGRDARIRAMCSERDRAHTRRSGWARDRCDLHVLEAVRRARDRALVARLHAARTQARRASRLSRDRPHRRAHRRSPDCFSACCVTRTACSRTTSGLALVLGWCGRARSRDLRMAESPRIAPR